MPGVGWYAAAGGDVDEDAPVSPERARGAALVRRVRGDDVEGEHLVEAVRIGLGERGGDPEAGVVDERVDGEAVGLEVGEETVHPVGGCEVLSEHVHRDAMRGREFIGERLEPIPAPGDEDEVGPRAANWRANSAPRPELAPVTSAVVPRWSSGARLIGPLPCPPSVPRHRRGCGRRAPRRMPGSVPCRGRRRRRHGGARRHDALLIVDARLLDRVLERPLRLPGERVEPFLDIRQPGHRPPREGVRAVVVRRCEDGDRGVAEQGERFARGESALEQFA